MIVYISGAITNEAKHKEKFQNAEDFLLNNGIQPINPLKVAKCPMQTCNPDVKPSEPYHHTWICALKYDIAQLVFCHGVALLDNWAVSRGAKFEKYVATELGIPVHPLWDWRQL